MSDLSTIKSDFETYGVSFAAVFGSQVTGLATKDSDYDFLIEFDPKKKYTLFDLSALKSRLEEKLHTSVDLVTTKALHPYMSQSVMSQMQVLYDNRS